jgi:hypothetical protein
LEDNDRTVDDCIGELRFAKLFALVIDDDVSGRQALYDELSAHLRPEGFVKGVSGIAGPALARELRPELVLVDFELATRSNWGRIPTPPPALTILSAADGQQVDRLRDQGGRVWTKPEVFSRLRIILRWAEIGRETPAERCHDWARALHMAEHPPALDPHIPVLDAGSRIVISRYSIRAARQVAGSTRILAEDRIVAPPRAPGWQSPL